MGRKEGGTELLTDILQTAPQVKILATSRANLNLPQEHRFPIPGMAFPDPGALERATDYSAVKLFLEAARRAQPDFAASADSLREVVRICRLVDGMPLGVLLAAGWLPMLSPTEIATEIEKSLDFLETDLRGVPERQRSVRAVFDHSWRLLTDREQEWLAQLSVFRGGFTRRAAQVVTGATLRELKGLVDKSLLQHTPGARYDLHELLRQYSAERLEAHPDSARAARDRHSAYYAGFLERRAEQLKGARQQIALAEIEADADNASTAWNWAVEQGQVERLGRAIEGLCLFYERQGRYEQGDRACRRAVEGLTEMGARDDASSGYEVRVRARALTWRGVFSAHSGSGEIALQLVRQSLVLLDRPELADQDTRAERAGALREMGATTIMTGEPDRAGGLMEGSLALYRELGDQWGMAQALAGLGGVAFGLGAFAEAQAWDSESLALRRELGDQRGVAESLNSVSSSLIAQGQFEEAMRLAREVIAISREIGDRVNLASGLLKLGWALRTDGRFAKAYGVSQESAAIWEELGSRSWLAWARGDMGYAQMHLGRYKDARAQLQAGLRLARETSYQIFCEISPVFLGWVALVEGAYSEARRWFQEGFSAAQMSGRRRHRNWAAAGLGFVERGLGNLRQARGYFYEALRLSAELEAPYYVLPPLPGIALLLTDEGQTERAVELYALASRYRYVANSQWFEDVVGKHITTASTTLPPEAVAAAQARGRARDLKETLAELLSELKAAVDAEA